MHRHGRFRDCLAVLAAVVLAMSWGVSLDAADSTPPGTPPAATASCQGSFIGSWSTTYGTLLIEPSQGNGVVGDYGGGRKISGEITGCKLVGEWIYTSGRRGTLAFVLQADGTAFMGAWWEPSGQQNVAWNGTKQ